MKILVTGASGLIGSRLCDFLEKDGQQVVKLLRGAPEKSSGNTQYWLPVEGRIDSALLEGVNAVVHLVGETVAQRWTDDAQKRIIDSRIKSTELLCSALAKLKSPPEVVIQGSAIGFYGDRGTTPVTESDPKGSGFLAGLCLDWEAACRAAKDAGIRVVNLRTGVVLSTKGGALQKMLPPFQLGIGGILGSGDQYISWVSMLDVVHAIKFIIDNKGLSGPVNLVSPKPVTNHDFTKALGKVLCRPTICPVPAAVVQFAMGQMADEMLLTGAKVLPAKLESAGYKFRLPNIEDGLSDALKNS